MSETITVTGRSINTITAEIVALSNQAAQNAWFSMVEIGKRLVEAKALVDHGEWGSYLKNEVNFSQRTANNFMSIYQEHAKNPNSQALANLSYTKIVRLLAMPENDRQELLEEHDVSDLSSRELDKLIKERDEARSAKESADAEIQQLQVRLLDAQQQASAAKSSEDAWQSEIDKLNAALTKANEETAKARKQAQYLQDHPTIPKSMKDKMISDAKAEAVKSSEKAVSDLQAELQAARQEAAAATRDKAAAELAVQDAQKALADAQKAAKLADPASTMFRETFQTWRDDFNRLMGCLLKVTNTDAEKGAELKAAVRKMLDLMGEKVA